MASAPELDELPRQSPAPGGDGPYWPEGVVQVLLATDLVTQPTREALCPRLARPDTTEPRFFEAWHFRLLRAVCTRLVPQPGRARPVDIAGLIDARLADGVGDGWRYADLPPDRITQVQGLDGIAESASALFGDTFHKLETTEQDVVLLAVQKGTAPGPTWRTLPGPRYFEELLADVVDVYYAHPAAQEEIGFVGMADARGWQAVGLNQRAAHEPLPTSKRTGVAHG